MVRALDNIEQGLQARFHERSSTGSLAILLATPAPSFDAWLSALFKSVRGEASGFFKRRYSF